MRVMNDVLKIKCVTHIANNNQNDGSKLIIVDGKNDDYKNAFKKLKHAQFWM